MPAESLEPSVPLVVFRWPVPGSGFRWLEAEGRGFPPIHEGEEGHWLVVAETPGLEARPGRFYTPLDDAPELLRIFAELPTTAGQALQEAVLRFANRYGWLGLLPPKQIPATGGRFRRGRRTEVAWSESLAAWAMQVRLLRQVVDLLEAFFSEDWDQLNEWLRLGPGSILYSRSEYGFRRIGIELGNEVAQYIEPGKPDQLGRAARFIAQHFINRGLLENTSARLLYDPPSDELGVHIVPRNLLGALYIQAAEAAAGDRQYRRCEQCSTWFAITRDLTRNDRLYCSNACRSKSYRRRQDEARRLRKEGLSPSAIARKLHAKDTQTVRSWLDMERTSRGRRK